MGLLALAAIMLLSFNLYRLLNEVVATTRWTHHVAGMLPLPEPAVIARILRKDGRETPRKSNAELMRYAIDNGLLTQLGREAGKHTRLACRKLPTPTKAYAYTRSGSPDGDGDGDKSC